MEGHRTLASVAIFPQIEITGGYHRVLMRGGTGEIVQAMFKLDKQISCKIQQRARILLRLSSLRLAWTICRMHNECLKAILSHQPFPLYASAS